MWPCSAPRLCRAYGGQCLSVALACPSCRAAWPASAADLLLDARRVHSVPIPAPAPDHDTTPDLHRAAMAPPPPAHILPLCCPRVYLANPRAAASEGAWEELPDRHMHWAPVHNRQSGEWRAEWACLRCNTTVDESHPLLAAIPERPLCTLHGPRALALDLREQSRGWVCCRGSPAEILPRTPVRIPLMEDSGPVDSTAPAQLGDSQPTHPNLGDRAMGSAGWFQQGPPPP